MDEKKGIYVVGNTKNRSLAKRARTRIRMRLATERTLDIESTKVGYACFLVERYDNNQRLRHLSHLPSPAVKKKQLLYPGSQDSHPSLLHPRAPT